MLCTKRCCGSSEVGRGNLEVTMSRGRILDSVIWLDSLEPLWVSAIVNVSVSFQLKQRPRTGVGVEKRVFSLTRSVTWHVLAVSSVIVTAATHRYGSAFLGFSQPVSVD